MPTAPSVISRARSTPSPRSLSAWSPAATSCRSTLTSSSGALYGGFLHNVVQRVAQYICDTTVVDFVAHHELRIDHVYETFYTLIMGLLMYIRTHPDVPDETVKEIIASTLHIEGYTAKYPERKPQN